MKRTIQETPGPSSTTVPPPKKLNSQRNGSNLEPGSIYFTPIGGISVPRQESESSRSLDEILADIRPINSLHFSFMLDFEFLIGSYPPSLREYPITLVVGAPDAPDLLKCTKNQKLVTVVGASLPIPFGTHHTKMSILEDEDGRFHVIVSTANLVPDDWEFKTQQFYYNFGVKIASGTVPRSDFQDDLLEYLSMYRNQLDTWKQLLQKVDFSQISDRLIFSTPGYHTDPPTQRPGHPRLFRILSEKFPFDASYEHTERCTFVAQCSSIGSLGSAPINWFRGQFLQSLEGANPSPKQKPAKMYLVFPSVEDVRTSCQGYAGGCSVPYRNSVHGRGIFLLGK